MKAMSWNQKRKRLRSTLLTTSRTSRRRELLCVIEAHLPERFDPAAPVKVDRHAAEQHDQQAYAEAPGIGQVVVRRGLVTAGQGRLIAHLRVRLILEAARLGDIGLGNQQIGRLESLLEFPPGRKVVAHHLKTDPSVLVAHRFLAPPLVTDETNARTRKRKT